MEARRLQEETKKMLRSVLLPNKEGLLLSGVSSLQLSTLDIRHSKQLPTSDLEREFQGIVGYPIPWRKLGHMSLLEMVCSSLSQGFRIHLEMI